MEKPPKVVAVTPKTAGRDPNEYTGRFTFYTLVVIIAGATTGLLLGYVTVSRCRKSTRASSYSWPLWMSQSPTVDRCPPMRY